MAKKDLSKIKKPTKNEVKLGEVLDVAQIYLKEDSWFSGLKKLTTSKKATMLLKSLVGLLAAWAGASTIVENPDMQGYIAMTVMALGSLLVGMYMHAQGKSDGAGGKETKDKEAKNIAMLELTKVIQAEVYKLDKKKKK